MSQEKLKILDSMAYNREGIFADEIIRKNYYAARRLLSKQRAAAVRNNYYILENALLIEYIVAETKKATYVIKEIKREPAPIMKISDEELQPGMWYCNECGKEIERKICKHIFIVVLNTIDDPLIILKDKVYNLSKQAIEGAKQFLESLIKSSDRIKRLSDKKLLISGTQRNYIVKIVGKKIYVHPTNSPQDSYCVETHTNLGLKFTPYPLEDIIASLILFLLNDHLTLSDL